MTSEEEHRRAVRAILAQALGAAPLSEAERRRAEDALTRRCITVERETLRSAVQAAWAVGGRYNWETIRSKDRSTYRLFLTRGAWEATRAVERLMPPEPVEEVEIALLPPPARTRTGLPTLFGAMLGRVFGRAPTG